MFLIILVCFYVFPSFFLILFFCGRVTLNISFSPKLVVNLMEKVDALIKCLNVSLASTLNDNRKQNEVIPLLFSLDQRYRVPTVNNLIINSHHKLFVSRDGIDLLCEWIGATHDQQQTLMATSKLLEVPLSPITSNFVR